MKLIKPYTEILTDINGKEILQFLERVARTCYKSEDKITEGSSEKLISMLIKNGHEAMIEFFDITVKFVCDRGVSHEIVRHRIGSYAQESTRYCNYSKDKFDNQITYIIPVWASDIEENVYSGIEGAEEIESLSISEDSKNWITAMAYSEYYYNLLINSGWQAQQARSVLPNSTKTEINVKYNLREWRHFFKLRISPAAHPQMRELTIPLLQKFQENIPIIFDNISSSK
jgi:thymidylate synthase (FAD)